MQIDLSSNEVWKILDAIETYKNDYAVSVAVQKTFANIEKKLKQAVNSANSK